MTSMQHDAVSSEPDGAARIAMLDILRGVAILGILFMNISDMGASFNDPDVRHLGWGAADRAAWIVRAILADGTARGLLELLFGAGMVILTDRMATTAQDRWSVLQRYWTRNLVLWVFGMIHVFVLMWPGDILHTYGVAAIVAVLFRTLPPRRLIEIGLAGAVLQVCFASYYIDYQSHRQALDFAAINGKVAAHRPLTPAERETLARFAERAAEQTKAAAEHAAAVVKEDKARSGTARSWFAAAVATSIDRLGTSELFSVWEAAGTMLIGAALFKLGILQGRRRRRCYVLMMIAAYGVGLPLRGVEVMLTMRFDDQPHWTIAFAEVARLATTLGHVALLCLVAGTVTGGRLLRPFVAAGRTALTIYILQSLIGLWLLFPPFALALYGKLTWWSLMLVSGGIDLLLLAVATLYVRQFSVAPVEWAWRSIVERRSLPWRARPNAV